MNTSIDVVIEKIEITTPPIAGPVLRIVRPSISPKSVKTNAANFLVFVVDRLSVGILRISQPIGAPSIEIKIITETTRAKDSITNFSSNTMICGIHCFINHP